MINVGIVGGTGYTGVELLRLLAQHPKVKIKAITSRSEAGMSVAELFTNLRGHIDLKFSDPADAKLTKCDVVFFRHTEWHCDAASRIPVESGCKSH